jgi:hypothetical protein
MSEVISFNPGTSRRHNTEVYPTNAVNFGFLVVSAAQERWNSYSRSSKNVNFGFPVVIAAQERAFSQ